MDRSLICCDFIFVVGASRVARGEKSHFRQKAKNQVSCGRVYLQGSV